MRVSLPISTLLVRDPDPWAPARARGPAELEHEVRSDRLPSPTLPRIPSVPKYFLLIPLRSLIDRRDQASTHLAWRPRRGPAQIRAPACAASVAAASPPGRRPRDRTSGDSRRSSTCATGRPAAGSRSSRQPAGPRSSARLCARSCRSRSPGRSSGARAAMPDPRRPARASRKVTHLGAPHRRSGASCMVPARPACASGRPAAGSRRRLGRAPGRSARTSLISRRRAPPPRASPRACWYRPRPRQSRRAAAPRPPAANAVDLLLLAETRGRRGGSIRRRHR
jgi:hypothetical protein